MENILLILWFGFLLWFLAGTLLQMLRGLSFAINPDPNWLADGANSDAGSAVVSLIKHGFLWPYAGVKCHTADDHIYGHWCGFVEYKEGHYPDWLPVERSMQKTHPDWKAPQRGNQ